MSAIEAIDAWAQPVPGRTRRDLPEVVRLLEKSGTAQFLDLKLSPAEIVAVMDAAGVRKLLLSAWCRPGRWLITNDEVAAPTSRPSRIALRVWLRWTWRIRWRQCANCGGLCVISGSMLCAWCRGFGSCRPMTSSTTRRTSNASN